MQILVSLKYWKKFYDIEVTGVTVTNVIGCGIQKGRIEYYCGTELDMNLLPKIKLEIVVKKVPVELEVNTIKSVLYSGNLSLTAELPI